MSSEILIFTIIFGAIGASLFFIGWLCSLLVALGNKQYAFGIGLIIINPLAHLYCALHWHKAAYAGKMLYAGTVMLAITLGFLAFYDFQLFPAQKP